MGLFINLEGDELKSVHVVYLMSPESDNPVYITGEVLAIGARFALRLMLVVLMVMALHILACVWCCGCCCFASKDEFDKVIILHEIQVVPQATPATAHVSIEAQPKVEAPESTDAPLKATALSSPAAGSAQI